MNASTLSDTFITYRSRVDHLLMEAVTKMGEKTALRDAIEYALQSGGKRFRPIIVQMISDALGKERTVDPIALSVEYFHTASLIADDLPCMDDDDERRARPVLHKAFDEATAILASYTLISMGYEKISENTKIAIEEGVSSDCAHRICRECLDVITRCAGIFGATSGQFLDLYPPDYSLETLKKIIYQKTVTLFEISFVCGWLFSGGSLDKIEELKGVAYDFGMAFQIADDLKDLLQDEKQTLKSNIAYVLGKASAFQLFNEHITSLEKRMQELGLWSEPLQQLYFGLKGLASVS